MNTSGCASAGAETPAVQTGYSSVLMTSHDTERYAKFTIDGDTVNIAGCFAGDRLLEFYIDIPMAAAQKESIKVNNDGTFSGYFSGVPVSNTGYAVLVFESGKSCKYRIDYKNGWYFSVNGLDEYTMDNVENYIEVPDEVSAYYVCEDLDVARTRDTLSEIRRIAEEVTNGLTDDYEKAKKLSEWVSDNIYYDYAARDTEVTLSTVTLENVLKTRSTVCTGYANLYGALLEAAGIKAVNIQGGVVSSGKCTYEELAAKTVKHEWVAFYYEAQSRWVYTDVVWDSGNSYNNNRFNKGNLPMKYFDIDGLALSLDHRGDKAELRHYLAANEFVQNNVKSTTGDETDTDTEQITAETADTAKSNQSPGNVTNNQNQAQSGEDDTLLYAAIGALSLGIIIAAALLIKQLRRK